uniref:ANK_REP_REGION domain-containing protein n=1 Tax=Macrostomum lignano TaxID=282301 RepID=A0A1I8GCL5_9PLAT
MNLMNFPIITKQVRPPSASLQLIRALLDRGADPDLTDSYGNNLLQVAVRESNIALVRLLLTENNVNFHHRNANGDTVLHLLAGQSPELCRMVLRAARRFHIDCDQGNADGVTPLMAACRAGNLPVAQLFASSGSASFTKRDLRRRWTAYDWLRTGLGRAGDSSGKLDEMQPQQQQQWLLRLQHPELAAESEADPYQQIRESRRLETLSRLFNTAQPRRDSGQPDADEDQQDQQGSERQTVAAAEAPHLPPVPATRQASQLQLLEDARSRSSQSSFCRAATADCRISQARLISGIFNAYETTLTGGYRRPAVPLPASAAFGVADGGADQIRPGSRPHSRLSSGRSQRSPLNNSNNSGSMARRMTEFAGAGMRLKQRL